MRRGSSGPASSAAALARWGSFVGTLACVHLFANDEQRPVHDGDDRDDGADKAWSVSFRSLFASLVPSAVVAFATGCPIGHGSGPREPYTSEYKTNRCDHRDSSTLRFRARVRPTTTSRGLPAAAAALCEQARRLLHRHARAPPQSPFPLSVFVCACT